MAKSQLKTAPQASKTVVVEGSKFTVAEARHQKNRLRRDPAMVRCLVQSGHEDFTSSFIATRLNGWESWQSWSPFITLFRFLGGKGTMAQFNKEWQDLGLNKDQASHIRKAIIKRNWLLFGNTYDAFSDNEMTTELADVWNRSDRLLLYYFFCTIIIVHESVSLINEIAEGRNRWDSCLHKILLASPCATMCFTD